MCHEKKIQTSLFIFYLSEVKKKCILSAKSPDPISSNTYFTIANLIYVGSILVRVLPHLICPNTKESASLATYIG